jgi:hypothetical protein
MRNITKKAISLLALCLTGAFANAEGTVSGSVSFDYNSHFMSYGFDVWGAGNDPELLFQPSGSLDFNYGNYGFYTGVWFDINDQAKSSLGGDFQEVDVWVGAYYTIESITLDVAFQQWYYGGETEGILDFTISYDAMLAPYAKLHYRMDGVGAQDEGTVLEIGGGYDINEIFSIPLAIGLGLTDGYQGGDSGFGYASTGLSFSVPVEFLTGAWDFHGGIKGFYVNDDFAPGNPDEAFLTFNVGMGLAF